MQKITIYFILYVHLASRVKQWANAIQRTTPGNDIATIIIYKIRYRIIRILKCHQRRTSKGVLLCRLPCMEMWLANIKTSPLIVRKVYRIASVRYKENVYEGFQLLGLQNRTRSHVLSSGRYRSWNFTAKKIDEDRRSIIGANEPTPFNELTNAQIWNQ